VWAFEVANVEATRSTIEKYEKQIENEVNPLFHVRLIDDYIVCGPEAILNKIAARAPKRP
jgi:hypothetical protein